MTLLWVCIFRFRRPINLSPMVEVWIPFLVSVTSVFGERVGGSPMVEVWDLFSGSVPSVFGEWLVGRR